MEASDTAKRTDSRESSLVLLYGTLDYDGRAQRMAEILRGMGDVTVVDLSTSKIKKIGQAVGIRRIHIHLPRKSDGITRKLYRHIYFWCAALRVALKERPSVIIAENFFTSFPGWLSAKLCGARLVYDAYELIIPDPSLEMSKRDLFWYRLEKWTVNRADLVIAANEDRAHLMAEHFGLKKAPVVMRNIPPRKNLELGTDNILEQFPVLARRKPEDVMVLYQGDVALDRGIGRFVEAMKHLPPQFRLVVVGDGPDLDRLKEEAKSIEKNGQFISLGRVPHRLLPAITRLADVGIVTYPFKGLNNIYCSPNKIFEYAQAGLPMVATNQPPLRKWVEGYGIGELVGEDDDPEMIAQLIQVVAENRSNYGEALKRFLEDFRWENEAERVEAAIISILTESKDAS